MKIDRLYTLSQFVDLMYSLPENECSTPLSLDLIHYYNEFLKKPLKKEMFVNEITFSYAYGKYTYYDSEGNFSTLKSWEVAEKKVIFENLVDYPKIIVLEDYSIPIESMGELTLSDLAEKTNGQLKLKNVEL
jgi:hypothetical protein